MMQKKIFIAVGLLLIISGQVTGQKLWGNLKHGVYQVGFRTVKQRDPSRNNRPLIVSIWYPAKERGQPLTFRDYLISGIINESFSDPTTEEEVKYIKEFKDIFSLPHLFGLPEDSLQQFNAVLEMPAGATRNAPEAGGQFPAIIMSSEPESLCVTAEYFASNGFVVAAVQAPYNQSMPPDSLVWVSATRDMVWLAEYTKKINSIDQNKIAALGFGGGIIPSFYLTMKTNQLKALVNLEGGVFQPFSLITKSIDYHPEKMKTPMLHIVTAGTRKNESEQEIKAIRTTLYRLLIENNEITHHDFSIFGRVLNKGLGLHNKIGEQTETAYVAVHQVILAFINSYLMTNPHKFDTSNLKEVFIVEE